MSEAAFLSVRVISGENPLSIPLSKQERERVASAAAAATMTVSDYVRAVCAKAAGTDPDIEKAAKLAGLSLKMWVRMMVLEAAGVTTERQHIANRRVQLDRAAKAVRT